MKISYHPFYSILHNCSKEQVKCLSDLLAHSIPVELLEPFKKAGDLPITHTYLFKAYSNSTNNFDVRLLSGLLPKVVSYIKSDECFDFFGNIEFVNYVDKYIPSEYSIGSILMDHQRNIVQSCLKTKRGLIKSPTSSGKSFSIAELVRILNKDNLKTLITVPTISLLHQMVEDINRYCIMSNFPTLEIGKIGDGLFDPKNITIGIPNSLIKLDRTKEYLKTVDALLADEVHLCANVMYFTVMQNTPQRKVTLGLSATPEVSNLDLLLEGFFGNRLITITEEDMIKNKVILEPAFKFYTAPKAFLPNKLMESASNISSLSDAHRYKIMPQIYNYIIIKNTGRNNLIVSKSIEEINKDNGPIIIVVNKVKGVDNHADILYDLFKVKGLELPIISGYLSKKKREQILNDLKSSSIKGVIAGPKVLTAGISIPSLSSIILAGAGKSNTDFIQRVGRLLRKKEGKQQPTVIDFIDQQYWFQKQSESRINIAKQVYGTHNIFINK
jgi:superfamily II DNA or RNA helicase